MSSFNDDFTLLEMEQIRNSREYQDRLAAGSGLEADSCDLNRDLNGVLSQIRRVMFGEPSGQGNWYDNPPVSLDDLTGASGFDPSDIEEFIGKTGPSGQPHYDCTFFYSQNVSLREAIDSLCEALNTVSGLVISSNTWNEVFDNGSGILNVDVFDADIRFDPDRVWRFTNQDGSVDSAIFSSSGALVRQLGFREHLEITANVDPGDTITIPNSRVYTLGDTVNDQYPNLEVYWNGNLLSPGSGVNPGDELRRDYREDTNSTIITNRRLLASPARPGRLTFRIYG